MPISTKEGFENLKRNIINLAEDLRNNNNSMVCIVSNKDLLSEISKFLQDYFDDSECLVIFSERSLPLKDSLEYLTDEFVFVANEFLYLPLNIISRLYANYLKFPKAGFVAGYFTEYPIGYWVDDIYSKTPKIIYSNEKELEDLQEVDIVLPPYGLLTRTANFKDLFFRGEIVGAEYGLRLRQQGFKNYVDTNIKLNYGKEVLPK